MIYRIIHLEIDFHLRSFFYITRSNLYSCKNLTSHILISKNDAGSIYSQRNYILSEIKKRMEKKPNQLFERNSASTQLNKANKKYV